MLHEVLLALSGHPSSLFSDLSAIQEPRAGQASTFPILAPSERALLHSIGILSELHRKLRQHVRLIAAQHKSTVCRAVATSIQHTHLSRFQEKILSVEEKILTKDASVVGAYDIVPLAGIVSEFDDWNRRMAWYWDIACFMTAPDVLSSTTAKDPSRCSGDAIIDRLRQEQQTGFPDLEDAAVELSKIAETAWLRQVASWVVHGQLPVFAAEDFFIRQVMAPDGDGPHFVQDRSLLPKFVTTTTARSILFIGKSLHQVRRYTSQNHQANDLKGHTIYDRDVSSKHLHQLSSLSLPIVPAQLSRAVSDIRHSLSQGVLRHILPIEKTIALLTCFQQFFLLSRGDFAFVLIDSAQNRLQSRQEGMGRLLQQDPIKTLQGLTIKDTEMHQTLAQSFKALASQDEDQDDEILDFARTYLSLGTPAKVSSRPPSSDGQDITAVSVSPVAFNDLLFPTATSLKFNVPAPFELFVSSRDLEVYSSINAYLLAIERAYLRLSNLWKETSARRDHPTVSLISEEARSRVLSRRLTTRKIWATCSAAIFLLSETARYLEGEVTKQSWEHFEQWIKESPNAGKHGPLDLQNMSRGNDSSTQRDPETLASGHRLFLAALTYALLLTDLTYTKELRSLLGNIESLIAYFRAVLDVQQKLDLEHESGGETGHTLGEEKRVSLELDRARKKVDSDLKSVINRLRQLDQERVGRGRFLDTGVSECRFEPWKGGGVDRLLMRLEFVGKDGAF